jgi:hypothetical protein
MFGRNGDLVSGVVGQQQGGGQASHASAEQLSDMIILEAGRW